MELKLSIPLINKIREALSEAKPVELYWDDRQTLSASQMNKILVLPDGLSQVEQEILDCNEEEIYRLEVDSALEVLKEFRGIIAEELHMDEEEITDDTLQYLVNEYDLHLEGPGVDSNMERLIRNSRPRIVLQLPMYHEHEGWQWRSTADYEDVRDALQLFNINPRKVHKKFPNLPYRNGKEYLLPKDLIELWDNACYGGKYVMPIDLNLTDYHKNRHHYHTGIMLHKGSEIWLHDYVNGSGSISIPLQKDLTILRKNLIYHFGDDNDTAGYGLDEVYGLTQSAWDNSISPIKTDPPGRHELPPPEKVFQYIMYGNVYSPMQTSSFIRPFNDCRPIRWGEIPKPGEMMAWDINHSLWDNFPKEGRKYLTETADKSAAHCVFKIKELIGQVSITHCQFIVHDPSREILWSIITESERSYEIFKSVKEMIKNTKKPEFIGNENRDATRQP